MNKLIQEIGKNQLRGLHEDPKEVERTNQSHLSAKKADASST
jgi:hypothetical protein